MAMTSKEGSGVSADTKPLRMVKKKPQGDASKTHSAGAKVLAQTKKEDGFVRALSCTRCPPAVLLNAHRKNATPTRATC